MFNISSLIIPLMILTIITYAKYKKVEVYNQFVEGAKDGLKTAISVLPYLLTMLIAIGIFRDSGLLDFIINFLKPILQKISFPPEVLPLALMRPVSGSGSLAILTDILKTYHPDSLIGRTASTMMGSTETTFYILALYYGSIGIEYYRYTIKAALIADLAGVVSSVIICNIIFG